MIRLLFLFLIFTLFSCKEKTYEELEVEVLCDVLPQLTDQLILIPPPPMNSEPFLTDYKPYLLPGYENYIKRNQDSIKKLAKLKGKLTIGVNDYLHYIDYETINNIKSIASNLDSLPSRLIKSRDLKESTLNLKVISRDTVSKYFFVDSEIMGLANFSRVLIDSNKEKAFLSFSQGKSFLDYFVFIEKRKNKWIVVKIKESL